MNLLIQLIQGVVCLRIDLQLINCHSLITILYQECVKEPRKKGS